MDGPALEVLEHVQTRPLAVNELGSCASSGRALCPGRTLAPHQATVAASPAFDIQVARVIPISPRPIRKR